MARDLTKGGITQNLIRMAVPTMIGFGAQMLFDLVDIFWIGRISARAVAGVTVFSTLFWVIEALNEVIGISSISLISQAFGSGDKQRTDRAIEQTIACKFAAATAAALIMLVFLQPLLALFVKGDSLRFGMSYGYIRLFFLPVLYSSFSIFTALRCIGDARTAMRIMILTNLLNFLLDPLLIFARVPYLDLPGLNLGVFGAALATVVSQTLAFGLGMHILFSGKKGVHPSWRGLLSPDPVIARKLLTIGLPSGAEVLLRNLAHTVVLGFVSTFGDAAITAVGIGSRLFNLAFMPLMGLSTGGAAMTGQSLGADDTKRAEKAALTSAVLSALAMAAATAAALIWPENLIRLFTGDRAVIAYGAEFLRYASLGLILVGFGCGLGSAFIGAGYNLPMLVSSFTGRWLIQLPLLCIAVKLMHLPIRWIWFSYLAGDLGEMLVRAAFYRCGGWRAMRVAGSVSQ